MSGLSELAFDHDCRELPQAEDATRWTVEKIGPLEVYVVISSIKAPDEKFQARLLWATYPEDPPSLKFRDPASGRLDLPTAWPVVRGFRPTSLDACVNWCLEGFTLHPEWKTDPDKKWNPAGNPLLRVIRTLQSEMDEHFSGRFKQ